MVKKKKINKTVPLFLYKKFLSLLLKEGKRTSSHKILQYLLFNFKSDKTFSENQNILILEKVLNEVLVRFIIKKRKKGKIVQQIPVPVLDDKVVYSNSIRFLVKTLSKSSKKNFTKLLLKEFSEILEGRGLVKKELLHFDKVVNENRKFIKNGVNY